MSNSQMIHTYKQFKGSKRPVITTALVLDRKEDGTVRGLAIGYSYCSRKDNPRRKTGNGIAYGRALRAIKSTNLVRESLSIKDFDSEAAFADACDRVGVSYHTRYGQNKQEVDENSEVYETGHPHFCYLPFPIVATSLKDLLIPAEKNIHGRLILAINNIQKHDRL